jgi:putative ABC transport system permease protein
MFFHYCTVAVRSLLRHRTYSLINLAGLSVGISCCIVIVLFVHIEIDQDRFHRLGDRIYRVVRISHDDTGDRNIGVTSGPFAEALKTDFPADIEAAVRVLPNNGLVTSGEKAFSEKRFYFADSNFFTFFSFPLIVGSPGAVLTNPASIVISSEMARKYFGSENPVGKRLTLDKEYHFHVAGVFEPVQRHSHLRFDFVASLDALRDLPWLRRWWSNSLITYIRMAEGARPAALTTLFPAFMDKYFDESFRNTGRRMDLGLEPLEDIYFNNATSFDFVAHGDRDVMYMFVAIAAFILLVSGINFMNLAIARAGTRAKEIGVRKTVGAHRRNLMAQFVSESALFAFFAFLVSLVLVEVMLPYFNSVYGLDLSLRTLAPHWLLSLAGGAVAIGLISGSYPALALASFRPVAVLKGRVPSGVHAPLRKILVVVQFTISIVLIVATVVVGKQMEFVRTKNLGFDKEHLVLVRVNNGEIYQNREMFRTELLRDRHITHVSAMSGEPGGFHDNYTFRVEGRGDINERIRTVFTDHDYVKTLGLEIVAGRDFVRERSTDDAGIILNETAARHLGWTNEEALGKHMVITLRDSVQRTVIGVVKNYHFTSLRNTMEPLAISLAPDHRVIAIRITSGDVQTSLSAIEAAWNNAAPGFPFEFQFYDQAYNELYRTEQMQQSAFGTFALIAVCIACLGLFGLSTYAIGQRTKEIGIRKVLGASVPGIVHLLSREFLQLVAVALLIAAPCGYVAMSRWLESFAYRIAIGWWVFAVAGGLTLVVAFGTVGLQAMKAALSNPVDALKYE